MPDTVTLSKGATEITLPAPAPGARVTHERVQASALSADGTEYVYDAGVTRYRKTERFESLTDAQKADLSSFFATVKGASETFDYTDSGGNAFTARFGGGALRFEKVAANVWDAETELVLDSLGK